MISSPRLTLEANCRSMAVVSRKLPVITYSICRIFSAGIEVSPDSHREIVRDEVPNRFAKSCCVSPVLFLSDSAVFALFSREMSISPILSRLDIVNIGIVLNG